MTLIAACALLVGGCDAPGGSSSDSSDAYSKGIEALEMFDFNEAYKQLSKYQPNLSPKDKNWLDATYAYAISSWHRPPPRKETIDQAVELFNELLAADIPEDWKARVRLSLGRIYEVDDYTGDSIDLEKARGFYQEVAKQYPTGELGYQATLRLAQTYVQQLNPEAIDKGVELLKQRIKQDPDSPWASLSYQYLGDLYANYYEDIAAALECYQHAEVIGFANESQAHFYLWQMSKWANQLGQQEEAVRLWTKVVEDYPRSPYGTVSRDHVRAYVNEHPESGITPPELKTW
ncbi:tetratricopeptide repeat protein [Cerasicoccus frondis]|uniref:tetratricopeptide repeat protein n=1 Tax=Cerasicoccus frondis TaxID=490090 RepID=UPI0028526EA8|nr:tetratricopeptide repeat protein [Cerasicoccus frondis]